MVAAPEGGVGKIRCGPSEIESNGVCRKRLHRNIGSAFSKLAQFRERQAKEREFKDAEQQLLQRRENLHKQFEEHRKAVKMHQKSLDPKPAKGKTKEKQPKQ